MEEDQPARDVGADNPNVPRGDDLEYDEAHDTPSSRLGAVSARRYVNPPEVNGGSGGDYGYDEAHDLRLR